MLSNHTTHINSGRKYELLETANYSIGDLISMSGAKSAFNSTINRLVQRDELVVHRVTDRDASEELIKSRKGDLNWV